MKSFLIKALKALGELIIILFITLILIKAVDHFFGLYSRFFWIISDKAAVAYRQPDPVLHHSLKPNSLGTLSSPEFNVIYKINSMGFRDYEYNLQKPENTYRIVMAGDSFVEGYGVSLEDTFTKVLEKNLKKNSPHYEVINAGIASYSPLPEYLLIKTKLLKLKPDLVMLVFHLGSDIANDKDYAMTAEFDGKNLPVKITLQGVLNAKYEKLNWLTKFFYNEIQIVKKLSGFLARGGKKTKAETFCYGDIIPEKNIVAGDNHNWRKQWEMTKYYLKSINELLKQNNIKFVIVMMPDPHHVNGKEWEKGRIFYDYKPGVTYQNHVFDYMNTFCGENNIPYYNLLTPYRQSNIFPIFYPADGHLTIEGNKLTADYLYNFLKTNNFLKR
jgi:hypothetical protein